jgi:aryl-phospho-beta-D-glucosidase BglC (GH1 family)
VRTIVRRLLVALVGLAVVATVPGPAAAAHKPGKPLSAGAVVAAMQPGWNLGNTFDAVGPDETAWGNPRVTEELLENLKAQGFRSIRIPVTWDQHLGEAPDYQIDPVWLARVQEVVGWALEDGFYVLLNMHHDSWLWVERMPAEHDTVLARYTAVWTQVADAFRDASPKLLFESINEPRFAGSSGDAENAALLHELNVVFHDVVRSSGGDNATRLLVLPSLFTSDDQIWLDGLAGTIAELADPNLIATFHFYGFWPFSVNVAGFTRFDATVQQDLTDRFDRVYDTLVANGVPVILGEYGLLGFDVHTGTVEQGEKLKFFEFLGYHARTRQLTTMLWDNGQHFQRTGFEWNDPALYRQIRSSWTVRSGTAATDLVFVERSAGAAAVTVTLNRNGHTFTGLFRGSKKLVKGKDYTISGDQLTFSARLLGKLTGGGSYGEAAVLTARFSRGVPWSFHVVAYDRPALADAAGTTDAFAIPAAFHGDQLATMEARYADGTNAGPHDWTSFKEFGRAFAPDYTAGEIALTPTFFGEVADGAPVTLTFHFWSGETLTYTVTRSGTAVTGVA